MTQLRRISALKHHYASTNFKLVIAPRGRYGLGTPRLAEAELMVIVMQKCPESVRDAILTDNLVVFTTCSISAREPYSAHVYAAGMAPEW